MFIVYIFDNLYSHAMRVIYIKQRLYNWHVAGCSGTLTSLFPKLQLETSPVQLK